jgi:hypothetical protein
MFDELIFLLHQYLLWMVLLLAVVKLLVLIIYRGLQPLFIGSTYLLIYSRNQIAEAKNNPKRNYFRKAHNLLTMCFYLLLGVWTIIHLTLIATGTSR